MGTYVIRGGIEGRERLRILARVLEPTTDTLLSEVGVPPTQADNPVRPTARCLDWGCGGGDVTTMLARRLPTGSVTGVDLDEVKVDLARAEAKEAGVTNVEFLTGDVLQPDAGPERYDLLYARFLLTHLPDPAKAVENMTANLAPGGALVLEDIDFRGHFCDPPSSAFSRYVDLYTQLVRSRGCDPNIGPRLPRLLQAAGLQDVGVRVVQPTSFVGDVKLVAPITLEAIADGLIGSKVLSVEELTQVVDELYAFAVDAGTVMSFPRIVQTWGRRPA